MKEIGTNCVYRFFVNDIEHNHLEFTLLHHKSKKVITVSFSDAIKTYFKFDDDGGRFTNFTKSFIGDNWEYAFSWAGWAKKRLCLRFDYRLIAMSYNYIPYIDNDSKTSPAIAKLKIVSFVVNSLVKYDWSYYKWWSAMRYPVSVVNRPDNWTSGKPKNLRDYRVIAFLNQVNRGNLLHKSYRYAVKNQGSLVFSNIHQAIYYADAVNIAGMIQDRIRIPNNYTDIVEWSNNIHMLYGQHGNNIHVVDGPLYGENFIPALEDARIKTVYDLRNAGTELGHCVGSYYRHKDLVHYRKGSVICQVDMPGNRIIQCLDSYNRKTKEAVKYAVEIQKCLDSRM